MKKAILNIKNYPEEKPKVSGEYFVFTVPEESFGWDIASYNSAKGVWLDRSDDEIRVDYWAELPPDPSK